MHRLLLTLWWLFPLALSIFVWEPVWDHYFVQYLPPLAVLASPFGATQVTQIVPLWSSRSAQRMRNALEPAGSVARSWFPALPPDAEVRRVPTVRHVARIEPQSHVRFN